MKAVSAMCPSLFAATTWAGQVTVQDVLARHIAGNLKCPAER